MEGICIRLFIHVRNVAGVYRFKFPFIQGKQFFHAYGFTVQREHAVISYGADEFRSRDLFIGFYQERAVIIPEERLN